MALNPRDHEFTDREIRRNRIQVVAIFVPIVLAVVGTLIALIQAVR